MTKQRQKLLLLIADNQPIFLQGLAKVFRPLPDIKIVAQCQDGLEAIAAIRKYAPDIAMIDLPMPGLNGLDILTTVNAEGLPTQIVFLTSAATNAQMQSAISGGAKAVLFKNSLPNDIVSSVRDVAAGKYQLPRQLAESMRELRAKRKRRHYPPRKILTPREIEVTQFVIKGLSNREIGRQMQLSEGTIKIHLHNIYKKLNVSNRTALATLMVSQ